MNFLILLLLSVFWGSNSFAENKKLPRTLQPIVLDSLKIRNDAKMNRMDLSELVEKWSFIRLEAAGIACAGEIRLVNVIDDYVLLEDIKDGKVRILLYSISGKFIAQIGEQGEGQGMYQYATAYTLNPFTKQVLVLDGKRNLRHVYNFEGKHLESGDLPEFSFMISDIRFVNKDVLLGSNKVMLDNPIAYFMTDIKFSQQQLVAPLNVTWSAGAISFASQAFSVFKGDISLLRPFCDTIFGYSENRLYPKVVLQTKNSVPRGYAIISGCDYMQTRHRLEIGGFEEKSRIFETNNYLWIEYQTGHLLYNKTTDKGLYHLNQTLYTAKMIPPQNIIGQTENSFVVSLTAAELFAWKQQLIQQHITPAKQFQKLLKDADGTGNPVLIFYTLKDL